MQNWNEIEDHAYFYLSEINETTDDNDDEVTLPQFTKLRLEYIESNEMMFTVMDGKHKGFDLYFYTNRDKPEDLLTENEYQPIKNDISIYWKNELKKIPQCPQRQDSLTDQMIDLYIVANKFGFYDAADFIRQNFMKKQMKR